MNAAVVLLKKVESVLLHNSESVTLDLSNQPDTTEVKLTYLPHARLRFTNKGSAQFDIRFLQTVNGTQSQGLVTVPGWGEAETNSEVIEIILVAKIYPLHFEIKKVT